MPLLLLGWVLGGEAVCDYFFFPIGMIVGGYLTNRSEALHATVTEYEKILLLGSVEDRVGI